MQSNTNKQHATGVYTAIDTLVNKRYLGQKITLSTPKRSAAIMDGDIRSRYRGRGMEFSEVRPYQAGDDIRSIDWRVTARTQKPHTKLFQEEKERPIFLLVDQRSPMFFGSRKQFKSVYAAELAATLAWAAQANNDRIGGMIFGDAINRELPARRGKHAVLQLLHDLYTSNSELSSPVGADHMPCLAERINDMRGQIRPSSSVFIISDFHDFDQQTLEAIGTLRRHVDLMLIHLFDPLEVRLPKVRDMPISDGHQRLMLSGAANSQARFEQIFRRRQNALREAASKLQLVYAAVDISLPLSEAIHDMFNTQRQKMSAASLTRARQ